MPFEKEPNNVVYGLTVNIIWGGYVFVEEQTQLSGWLHKVS